MTNNESILLGVVLEDNMSLTVNEVCQQYLIPKALLEEMIQHGLFEQQHPLHFTAGDLRRLESACRLHRDLDINLPGVALVLELLEEMEAMRQELRILKKHF
ncbi:MAG: molecular chaperone [Legionella sp.]|nr:MAG: molecular chaperone [Legionella sp.]PJD99849.1 MAG: molecular chaperone [Legionella sp.]